MRIAFFTDSFLPQVNGISTSIATFSKVLAQRGHKVTIFAPIPKKYATNYHENVSIIPTLSIPSFFYPQARISVLTIPIVLVQLMRERPDVVHFHTPLSLGISAIVCAKILRIPLVGTNHIYVTKDNHEFFKFASGNLSVQKILSRITIKYFQFIYNLCDVSTCPSKFLTEILKSYGFKNIQHLINPSPIKLIKILNKKERAVIRNKYHLEDKIILHYGRLSSEKNIDVVIMAFREVLKTNKNCSLFIIGDGPAKKYLEDFAKKRGIAKNIVFAGFIPHDKLLDSGIISLADVFATASNMENQSMVVIEAMSFGLPIVAVNEAGLSEEVSGNGYLVNRGDYKEMAKYIIKLFGEENLRKTMGKKSLVLAKNHGAENVAKNLLKLYGQIID